MTDNSKLGDSVVGYQGLVRPHYSAGLLLQDDDLTEGVNYTRALSRLMFRTLFGCGVLCGLRVKNPKSDQCHPFSVSIEKGVALDCVGDPIEVPAVELKVECGETVGNTVWIALRKREKCCAPRSAECCTDESEPACVSTRKRDGFEIQLFAERPPCSCGCKKLAPPHQQDPQHSTAKKKPTGAVKTGNPAPGPGPGAGAGAAAPADQGEEKRATDPDCLCNQRNQSGGCYEQFYNGDCTCDCCECEWILLAVADRKDAKSDWGVVDHSVRRFVRPVLMRDPLAP